VPARKRDFESIGVLISFISGNDKSEIYNATGEQQAAEKLGIFSANTKSVIPEVAKWLSVIQKKQYFNGYRISTSSRPV
jgi:hypothetical protein